MKKSTIAIVLFAIASVAVCAGLVLCVITVFFISSISPGGLGGVAGTYVNQNNPREYIELHSDGTFFIKGQWLGASGRWELKGSEIRLYSNTMGIVETVEIKGDRIYDNQGQVWVKSSSVPIVPIPTSRPRASPTRER